MFYLNNNKIPELDIIEQVNTVLKILVERKNEMMGVKLSDLTYEANTKIKNKVMPKYRSINFVLDKLIEEGYIIVKVGTDINKGEKRYFVTANGLLFEKEGGYRLSNKFVKSLFEIGILLIVGLIIAIISKLLKIS